MNTTQIRFLSTMFFANAATLLFIRAGMPAAGDGPMAGVDHTKAVSAPPVVMPSLVSTLRMQVAGDIARTTQKPIGAVVAAEANATMDSRAVAATQAPPLPTLAPLEAIWAEASDRGLAEPAGDWTPPDWFPEEARDSLWALEGVDHPAEVEGRPQGAGRLYSRAAFIYDLDSGRVLLSYGADERLPVASLTKMVGALAMMSEQPSLDEELCLDRSVMPSWPGATSRMRVGDCTRGWDLVGAALVHSDNGAASAMAQVAGLPMEPFVVRMNEVSRELGMSQSSFVDPSGAWDDNLSTARDMTRATIAVAMHPMLSPVASAPYWTVESRDKKPKRMGTTNSLLDQSGWEFLAAKTGYTNTARYCFSAVLRTSSGRTLAITTLGASRGRYRWSDVRNLLAWAERR